MLGLIFVNSTLAAFSVDMTLFSNFAESAYKEAMRISGTSMTIRHVTADTTIKTHDNKQYNLRKGDYTMFYSPIIQLNPDTYKEPEVSVTLAQRSLIVNLKLLRNLRRESFLFISHKEQTPKIP